MMDLWGFRIAATLEQLAEVRDGLKNYDPAGHAPTLTNDTKAGLAVNIAASLADQLKLESSALQVNTLRRASLFGMRMDQFILELEQLRRRIEEDLRKQYFLSVSSEMHKLWKRKDGFNLGSKFEDAQQDIEDAGSCLAVEQGTACVLHLMRALESVIHILSNELGMTVTHKTPWRVLTGNMDDKIKKMPDNTQEEKNKKNAWEESRINLHHIGSVWRNDTMHPAKSYTPSQALEIFNAVRIFMPSLAKL
jgi:hypothetical protein